jgi:alpha-galactosidase
MARCRRVWPFSPALTLAAVICYLALTSLAACGGSPSAGSGRPESVISSTVVPDGEIWFRHSQIQLRFDGEMYCRVFLKKQGKLYSINDIPPDPAKARPPQYITLGGEELKNFQVDYANVGVSEILTQFGQGKRLYLTGYAKTAKGAIVEKRLNVDLYIDFPDTAIVSASYRNTDPASELRITRQVTTLFRMDAARSQAGAPSYEFWILHAEREDATMVHRVDARYSKIARFDGVDSPLPLVDLWTGTMGTAIGDLSANPHNVVSAVAVGPDEKVEVEFQIVGTKQLAPGESLQTGKTVWMAHTGDFHAALDRYRELRAKASGRNRPKAVPIGH